MNTKKLALSAVFAALTIIFMYIGSVIKTGTLAIYFAVSLAGMAVVDRCGLRYAAAEYAAAAALALLLLPDKKLALSYAVIFGLYPFIKSAAERVSARPGEWAIKVLFFNIALTLLYTAIRLFAGTLSYKLPFAAMWLLANVFLICYDILLSRVYTVFRGFLKV